ncbi:hypothetical protein RM530_15130 [Algiphilus sp. W345]|uniref:Tetratricopeptide repeat protein n=1 Tax=Banduia mediterranea TaxID=3075609 RepID=A0ABU2WLB8_9GAMM|nr:hypothetical protein [Algiphilus sp. W345]MDT0498681.1 hypothetical protein [Algiphilus sp. W345]
MNKENRNRLIGVGAVLLSVASATYFFLVNSADEQAAKVDLTVPSLASERILYARFDPCEGAHAAQAVEVGFTHFHVWHDAVELGLKPPKHAFRDAGEAFRYLYEQLGCRNPMVVYAHARVLRIRQDWDALIPVIHPVYADMEAALPERASYVAYTMGASTKDPQEAIRHYRRALDYREDDNDSRVNLVSRLVSVGEYAEACTHILRAWDYPLSSYGWGTLNGLNAVVVHKYPECAARARERSQRRDGAT